MITFRLFVARTVVSALVVFATTRGKKHVLQLCEALFSFISPGAEPAVGSFILDLLLYARV